MSISISSSTPVQAPQKANPVEATQAKRDDKDVRKDGDADGGTTTKGSSTPQAFTNALGQLTGTTLNVKA